MITIKAEFNEIKNKDPIFERTNKAKTWFFGKNLIKLTNFGKTNQYNKRRGTNKQCLKCRGRDITDTAGIKRVINMNN